MSKAEQSTKILFVKNIGFEIRHDDLRKLFTKYGVINTITVPVDYISGKPRGFGFVEFEDIRDAEDALYAEDGTRYMGRDLEIAFAYGNKKTPAEMRERDERAGRGYRFSDYERHSGSRGNFREDWRAHDSRYPRSPRDYSPSPPRHTRHHDNHRRASRRSDRSRSPASHSKSAPMPTAQKLSAEEIMAANGVDLGSIKVQPVTVKQSKS